MLKIKSTIELVAVLAALLITEVARATSYYWDTDGASTSATGGAGIWDASSSLWRISSSTGTLSLWPNTNPGNADTAQLAGTAGTLTLNSSSVNINVNAITFGATGYIIAPPASGTARLNLVGTTPTIDTGHSPNSEAISAIITGSTGLTKASTGTLTLSSPNFTKTIGTASGSPTVTMANTTGVLVGDIINSANLVANTTITAVTPNTSVTISTNAAVTGSGTTATIIHPSTYTGQTLVKAGVLTVNGSGYTDTTANNERGVYVTMLGASGAGNETVVSAGAQVYFTDAFYHNIAEAFVVSGTGVSGTGVLYWNNSNWNLTGGLTLGGDSKFGGAACTISGPINLGSYTLTDAKVASGDTWGATISGTGGLTLTGLKLTLTGVNTYTGPTTVNAGILSVGKIANGGAASSPLGSATSDPANLVVGAGTLQYTGTTTNTDRGFTLATATSAIEVTSAAATLTLNGASAATGGGLTKLGAGTLTLAGVNLHSGATTISNGTLALSGSGSLARSSSLIVAAGALLDVSAVPFALGAGQTLSGDGAVAGAVTVNGTLAPGTGFGTGGPLTFYDPLTLAAQSTTVMQIARNGATLANARVQSANPLAFAGTLVIANVGGSLLQAGDSFQLFTGGSRSGSFTSIVYPPGYTFTDDLVANGTITVATAPPGPGFSKISASNGTLALAWPNNYQGWLVESNSVSLADSNSWFDLAGSDVGTMLNMAITNPALNKCFFRLRGCPNASDFANDPLTNAAGLAIGSVWSGVGVGFGLLTLKDVQIAAYYNSNRFMVLAARNLNSTNWYYQTTTEQFLGWDGHNYIAMDVDPTGYLHVAANMHNQAMNYYRSTQPVTNAVQFQTPGFIPQLASPLWNAACESQCTYPDWFKGLNDEFIFTYRSRVSGSSGSWHFLKYDTGSKTFAQPSGLNTPVFTWTGNYSVYPNYYVMGGCYHLLYVWRHGVAGVDNYRLSYVRSTNLVNWTDAFGRAVVLPIGSTATLPIVDDICEACGLLNGQPQLALDRDGVPLVAYSRFDGAGHSQVYVARPAPSSTNWNIVQLTTNNYWGVILNNIATTSSSGSVVNGFAGDDPVDGLVTVGVSMTDTSGVRDPNSGNYTLDETTLTNVVIGSGPVTTLYASANAPNAVSSFVDSGVLLNTYYDTNRSSAMGVYRGRFDGVGFANVHYYARWEALPSNSGYQPKYDRNGFLINPTPSALTLYRTAADFDDAVYGSMFKPANANLFGAMARTADSARTFGSSLASTIAGTANYAQWTFNVYTAGDYALGGSTYAASVSSNSFWVQVDNGPLIDWRITIGRWEYQPVTSGASKGQMRLSLSRGSHSLRLYAQAAGAKLEYLWLNQPSLTKASSLLPLTRTGFTLTADARTVSGYALSSASNPAGFTAHYEVPVSQSGNYLLLGRTKAPDTSANSFYLSINGGSPQAWTLPVSGTNWVWQAVGTNQNLIVGALKLDVSGLAGGALLDSFMLLKAP